MWTFKTFFRVMRNFDLAISPTIPGFPTPGTMIRSGDSARPHRQHWNIFSRYERRNSKNFGLKSLKNILLNSDFRLIFENFDGYISGLFFNKKGYLSHYTPFSFSKELLSSCSEIIKVFTSWIINGRMIFLAEALVRNSQNELKLAFAANWIKSGPLRIWMSSDANIKYCNFSLLANCSKIQK